MRLASTDTLLGTEQILLSFLSLFQYQVEASRLQLGVNESDPLVLTEEFESQFQLMLCDNYDDVSRPSVPCSLESVR